jgi:arylsulfatase
VLAAIGGVAGGFSLYVKNGKPVYEYNLVSVERTKITSTKSLAPGKNVVRVEFRYDGGGLGKGAAVSLFVNDKKVGQGRLNTTQWVGKYSADETFDIGQDSGTPASEAYRAPYRFTGTIEKVVIDTQPANLTAADQEKLRTAALAVD